MAFSWIALLFSLTASAQPLAPCRAGLIRLDHSALSEVLKARAEVQKQLNTYLEKILRGEALVAHKAEIAVQQALAQGHTALALQLSQDLAATYLRQGLIFEAAQVYRRQGDAESVKKADELQGQVLKSLQTSKIRFIRRLDTELHEYNGKQKGKTEAWVVETSDGIRAIFKPEPAFWEDLNAGKRWRDRMDGSTSSKEIQGYLDDQILGTHMVGPTVYRENLVSPSGRTKTGSLQYFFRDLVDRHGYEIAEALFPGQTEIEVWRSGGELQRKIVPVWRRLRTGSLNFFDYITDNKDRHADNFKFLPGGLLVAIDHAHSHDGPGNRWELRPDLKNIHEFVPDEEVLSRALALSDAEFVQALRDGGILSKKQASAANQRKNELIQLMRQAGLL